MLNYMTLPQNKLTLGSTVFNNVLSKAKVTRVENGFDQATIELPNPTIYPATVTAGTTVKLEVADANKSYPTNPMFKGVVRFPIIDLPPKNLVLSCLGSGYGLGEMVCVNEYGTQSTNPTADTLTEIATNMNDNFVTHILGTANNSNFGYTTDYTTTGITNVIPFIAFPYKPVIDCLNDLVDLVTALNAGSAGPHWIVTTDDVLHIKQVGGNQTGWTKYYGGATNTGQATLTYGEDYTHINSEVMLPEKNYIIYYGMWRRPSNGDFWTEANSGNWANATVLGGASDAVYSDSATYHVVGAKSLKHYATAGAERMWAIYPSTIDAHWDFSKFTDFNTPNLNFYFLQHTPYATCQVWLCTDTSNIFIYDFSTMVASQDVWYHVSLPCGPNYKINTSSPTWSKGGVGANPSWADINYILFVGGNEFYVDGLHFGDAPICRVAWNSNLPGGTAKLQLITDNTGKDDSLKASDDSGLMAQYAYAELLRKQKSTQNLTVDTPMLPEALPGQLFSIQSTDYRVTKIVHNISPTQYSTSFSMTDDVTNGISRPRYEDQNKVWASVRPEWQDKQASSIKAGSVDWRIAQLIKDYPT
jgi:hypothetical protein